MLVRRCVRRARGTRIFVVDKPDAVQTQIRIGRLGIPRDNPDYIPLTVTNQIFGGGYNSRGGDERRRTRTRTTAYAERRITPVSETDFRYPQR